MHFSFLHLIIKLNSGKNNIIADALSRLPMVEGNELKDVKENNSINLVTQVFEVI